MKPLLRLLSCQRQIMTLAIQTGKRFPAEDSPCRCKLYNVQPYISHCSNIQTDIKKHETIAQKRNVRKETLESDTLKKAIQTISLYVYM